MVADNCVNVVPMMLHDNNHQLLQTQMFVELVDHQNRVPFDTIVLQITGQIHHSRK
jgi:hypothetical protein